MPADVCPICFDGTLHMVAGTPNDWVAQCDTCRKKVRLDDSLEYDREYDVPDWYYYGGLLVVAACLFVAAAVDIPW
jgi:hypothetical protein